MKVVFITIPGKAKQQFIHTLYKEIGDALQLVVVQSSPPVSLRLRIKRFIKRSGLMIFNEVYFAILLRPPAFGPACTQNSH